MREGEILVNSNLEEMAHLIKMKEVMHLPFLPKFAYSIETKELEKFREKFDYNNKALVKTLKEFSLYKDYNTENLNKIKFRNLFKVLKEDTPEFIRISRQYIEEIHQLVEILPMFEIKDRKEIMTSLRRIKGFNKENFLDIFTHLQVKKVRKAILTNKSIDIIKIEIEKFKKMILKRNESLVYKKQYGSAYKEILSFKRLTHNKVYTYVSKMDLSPLSFIKDKVQADFWGRETLCCLKKGGVAEALLEIIENSPLAGEIVGKIGKKKVSSYTWDMVEIINGEARKTLILDNIEASLRLTEEEVEEFIFNKIFDYGKYRTLYLGICRNDCDLKEEYKEKEYERQSIISGFNRLVSTHTYAHADSDRMYKIREREEDKNIEYRKMNVSDLHLVKYIENYIYGKELYNSEDDKTDILKQVTLETPCYIIDNSTNIYGYFLTKWKWFDNLNMEVFDKKGKKRLYIEDLVVSKQKKALKLLKPIFDDFIKWIKEHNVKEVYLNPNQFSSNFIKRLSKEGITVVRENKNSILPKNFLK